MLHIGAQTDSPITVALFAKSMQMQIDEQDASGRTPLHWAIHHRSQLSLEYILSVPQDLELKDSDGFTVLHKAVSLLSKIENSTLFIKTLRLRGASIKTKTDAGASCLDLIPEDVSEETMAEAIWLVRKHRCSC